MLLEVRTTSIGRRAATTKTIETTKEQATSPKTFSLKVNRYPQFSEELTRQALLQCRHPSAQKKKKSKNLLSLKIPCSLQQRPNPVSRWWLPICASSISQSQLSTSVKNPCAKSASQNIWRKWKSQSKSRARKKNPKTQRQTNFPCFLETHRKIRSRLKRTWFAIAWSNSKTIKETSDTSTMKSTTECKRVSRT